jgi:4-amino-4-deoxy-L-arabinose transferase-like glycosyltransferase
MAASNTLAPMLLLLPSAWLACFLLARELAGRRCISPDWRLSFLLATTCWGALLTFGTEILSLATELNGPGVRLWWLLANAVLWGALWLLRRRSSPATIPWDFSAEWKALAVWPLDARIMLAVAALFAAFLGAIALLTPSNNWDSLTYHLPRVMHWVQQQSVAHYPTNMDGQIQMGPWSAFVQTHLWLLWGGDRFANLVQWSAVAGSMAAASRLAGQLLPEGTAPAVAARSQAFAALLVATLPTVIVESVTTQTDCTTGFWLLCFGSFALAWWRDPASRVYAFAFGAALGLGALTKFTMIIYAAPIGFATAAALAWRQRGALAQLLLPGTASLAICLAIVSPHFIRNRMVYGSAVGSQTVQAQTGVPRFSVPGILSNLIRNAQLQANTGMPPLTHALNQIANTLQGWTGRPPNDPEFSSGAKDSPPPDQFLVFDSYASSPWQVALTLAAAAAGFAGFRKSRLAMLGMGLGLVAAVLFCSILRWQIWNSRYHIPLLMFCMPLAAALLVPQIPRWLASVLAAGLLFFGCVILASNQSRPIFNAVYRAQPRIQQYFFSPLGEQFYAPMRDAVREIVASGCNAVGLKLSPDDAEYPLWLMLSEAGFKGRIDHEFVEGPSARLPGPDRLPDVIITTLPGRPVGEMGRLFPAQTRIGPYTLYWSAAIAQARTQAGK